MTIQMTNKTTSFLLLIPSFFPALTAQGFLCMKSNEIIPVVFNNDLRKILKHEYVKFCEKGGRGSCKSSFLSVAIILLMLQNKDYNALVLRKVADTLRDSVYEQLLWAIDKLGVADRFKATVSPLKIIYQPTGQQILFRGADQPEKIKSIKLKTGYFAVTWFEELTEFTEEDMNKIQLSTMRGGASFWIFYSFNPPASARNWCNMYFLKSPDVYVHHSDYRTVPRQWLGEAFIHEAQQMEQTNNRAYRNIFLGEATGTGSTVFENIQLREITEEEINGFEWLYYGVDFGYYPDPFIWVAMCYDMKNETLYIFNELKLYKHGNYEASEAMKKYGVTMADRITADSAEPKSVADFREYGWNMRGALKGKGSLDAGFKWLQSRKKIVIDPARCPESADEFSLYEHEIDRRTGEIIAGYPQGQEDHAMAAVRYALECVWMKRGN